MGGDLAVTPSLTITKLCPRFVGNIVWADRDAKGFQVLRYSGSGGKNWGRNFRDGEPFDLVFLPEENLVPEGRELWDSNPLSM